MKFFSQESKKKKQKEFPDVKFEESDLQSILLSIGFFGLLTDKKFGELNSLWMLETAHIFPLVTLD